MVRMEFIKYSASRLSLLSSVSTAMLFAIVVVYLVFHNAKNDFKERSQVIESHFIESSKLTVKSEAERIMRRIDSVRTSTLESKKNALELKVKAVSEYLILNLREDSRLNSEDFGRAISAFKGAGIEDNFFIISPDGTILYHEESPVYIGQNLLEVFYDDIDFLQTIEKIRVLSDSFSTYTLKSSDIGEDVEKVAYTVYQKELGVYIGSAFTMKEVDTHAQRDFLTFLRDERYGPDGSGYFWINTLGFRSVLSPALPEIEGKDMSENEIYKNSSLYTEVTEIIDKGSGFVEYNWIHPESGIKDRKMTYVTLYQPWDWVIGTGFYFSDLEKQIIDESQLMERLTEQSAKKVGKVVLYLFLLVIISGLLIFKMIRSLEKKQESHRMLLEQYKSILDKSAVVTITDELGVMTYVNDKFCEISGYAREELLGNRHNIIKHPSTPIETFVDLWSTITSGKLWKGVLRNRRKDGESFFISATISPITNEDGEIIEYIACANDITELMENRSRVEELFNSDSLTGLGSRTKLLNDAENMELPVLAILDIKGFKHFNEIYGNQFADRLLVEVAREFVSADTLKGYSIYRMHSDKFGVLANNADIVSFKSNISKAMRDVGAIIMERFGADKHIYFCAGIAADKDNLVAYADMALNGAKKLQQEVLVYSMADRYVLGEFQENLDIIGKVSEALKNDRVTAYYQPIVDLKSRSVSKYEGLIRVIDESGNIISPYKFLDISKKTNMYPKLTAKVIEKSVATFKNMYYGFSINLSVEDIFDRDTMDYLFVVAKNSGVLNRLTLEIVESQELVDIEETNRIFEKFKNAGVKIAIDDFGVGFSNFRYILDIKADYLKIDASIVKRVESDDAAKEIISSIVSIAKPSGMKTVAEFIENENIARIITGLGIDYGQGYYYGKPSPTPQVVNFKELI